MEEVKKEYLDETLIELRRLRQKENSDEIYVKGELVEFEINKLFDNKMEINLPKEFIDMPIDLAKIKYPTDNRPQVIKTDLLGRTNFAFNLFEQPALPSEINDIARSFLAVIKKANPATILYEKGNEILGESRISWFDFKGYAVDFQMYYLYYFTVIDGNLLHGLFNCKMDDMEEYKDVVFVAMRSIQDVGGKEDA